MSDLVKLIKELQEKNVEIRIDTETYLKEKAVDDMSKRHRIPKTNQYVHNIWNGFDSGELKEILIGGYGDANSQYGAGPTRLLPHASYDLRLFAIAKDVPLTKLYGLVSTNQLDDIFEDVRNRIDFGNRKYSKVSSNNNHVTLASGTIKKVDVSFSGIITNVCKKDMNYNGDISLYATQDLGYGDQFPIMLSTKDALSERDPSGMNLSGNDFQRCVLKSKKLLNDFANTFRINPDYRIWVLTVDNVNDI